MERPFQLDDHLIVQRHDNSALQADRVKQPPQAVFVTGQKRLHLEQDFLFLRILQLQIVGLKGPENLEIDRIVARRWNDVAHKKPSPGIVSAAAPAVQYSTAAGQAGDDECR